jgi:hypothetical protein
LTVGQHLLRASFLPADPMNFNEARLERFLTVLPYAPPLEWIPAPDLALGSALSERELCARCTDPGIQGRMEYSPALGSLLSSVGPMTLTARFVPSDPLNFLEARAQVLITVTRALPILLWAPSPSLPYGQGLTAEMLHPAAVTPCNMDMEGLINDSNRSIATLAITTLLKTGSESGVERLMKQITSFMSEIADEFKIVVVDAITILSAIMSNHSVIRLR